MSRPLQRIEAIEAGTRTFWRPWDDAEISEHLARGWRVLHVEVFGSRERVELTSKPLPQPDEPAEVAGKWGRRTGWKGPRRAYTGQPLDKRPTTRRKAGPLPTPARRGKTSPRPS